MFGILWKLWIWAYPSWHMNNVSCWEAQFGIREPCTLSHCDEWNKAPQQKTVGNSKTLYTLPTKCGLSWNRAPIQNINVDANSLTDTVGWWVYGAAEIRTAVWLTGSLKPRAPRYLSAHLTPHSAAHVCFVCARAFHLLKRAQMVSLPSVCLEMH